MSSTDVAARRPPGMRRATGALLLLLWLPAGPQPAAPAAPPDDWKGTNFVVASSASIVASGDPFDPSVHGAMTPQGEACSEQLNVAIYRQDVLHAFESAAHFDNCAFDDGIDYIAARVVQAQTALARVAADVPGVGVPPDVLAAMLAFGQALHGIQDFYAHSNYVELVQAAAQTLSSQTELPIVELWQPAAGQRLRALTANGLQSGRVWWSLPHGCPTTSPTHAQLAKDTPDSLAGRQASVFTNRLTGRPVSNHLVAFNLARRSSEGFLRWAGQSYPVLEKFCGSTLKYNVQLDRRTTE